MSSFHVVIVVDIPRIFVSGGNRWRRRDSGRKISMEDVSMPGY